MKWKTWLAKWDMTSIKLTTPFLEMEWEPRESDRSAAWELYIELLTRITTQPLPTEHGDEEAALKSVYALFAISREVIKKYGRECIEFTKIAVVVLNQVIRPFTAKWHKKSNSGAFERKEECDVFRDELSEIQQKLRVYTKMLADMADVEDLTQLQEAEPAL